MKFIGTMSNLLYFKEEAYSVREMIKKNTNTKEMFILKKGEEVIYS